VQSQIARSNTGSAERAFHRYSTGAFEEPRSPKEKDGYIAMRQLELDASDAEKASVRGKRIDWQGLSECVHDCCQKRHYVIDPHVSRFLPYWDIMIVVTIILQCFILPYQVGFCVDREIKKSYRLCKRMWPRALDAFYAVDIVLNFITMRPHPVHKRWLCTPNDIMKVYCGGQFWIDVLTVLPYKETAELLIPVLGPRFCAIGLLRLLGLLRLIRFSALTLRYEALMDIPFTWLKLLKLFTQLCLAVHVMACGWGFVLHAGYYLNLNYAEDRVTWVSVLRDAKPALFWSSDTETPMELYTASLYWSTMTITSIGYGDITATNGIEAWCATLAMALCGLIWAYIIGSICAIAAAFDDDSREHEATMESVNRMIRTMTLPRDVQVKLREYFMCRTSLRHHKHQSQLVRHMSPNLQTSVLRALEEKYVAQMWFLQGAQSHGFLLNIFEAFVFVMYPPQESLQLTGSMVVLLHGLVLRNARIMTEGCVWGIEEILLDNPRHHTLYTAISLAYSDLQHITKHVFQELLWHYPKERKRLRKLAIRLAICKAVSRKTVKPSWEIEQAEDKDTEEMDTMEPGYVMEIKSRLSTLESKVDKVLDLLQNKATMSHVPKIMSNVPSMSDSVKNLQQSKLSQKLNQVAHLGRKPERQVSDTANGASDAIPA